MDGAPFDVRASMTATGTVTLLAAQSGFRHHLCKGFFAVSVATGAATMSILETTDGGTTAAVLVGLLSASDTGLWSFDFGERGYAASATGARLALETLSSNSAVKAYTTGYTR